MSISAVGVGNVNAVNNVNNRCEHLKQKRDLSMIIGLIGLGLFTESMHVKSKAASFSCTTLGTISSLLGMYKFWKSNKELHELNKQQNLSIEI